MVKKKVKVVILNIVATYCNSPVKVQNICEATNFFINYFLSRTGVIFCRENLFWIILVNVPAADALADQKGCCRIAAGDRRTSREYFCTIIKKLYIPNAVISNKSPIFAIERWNFTQYVE